MNEQANITTVQQLYADFGQGKVPAILERVNPDVDWINAGPPSVPYARRRRGLGEVGEFYSTLAATVEVRNAVREVLAKPSYRQHARRLAQEYAQYDAVERGTASIQRLIGTRASNTRAAALAA
ncbi:MAG: hypothetical protein ABI887_07930 [Burkholderiales bacterium]